LPLTAQQRSYFDRANSYVHEDVLVDAVRRLVDIASPTGGEGMLARTIAMRLRERGLEGVEQPLDAQQSNAWGVIRGTVGGPSLLLYSPTDTVTSNDPAEDLPAAGEEFGPDMVARSSLHNSYVVGLGAQNPKGHAACVLVAAEAIKAAGIPLCSDLYVGFGAGGMPTNARAGTRPDSGHGVGCNRLAESLKPTFAVIAKTGWTVSWEEVGLVWYEVRVHGTHTYAGSRHLLPYVNPIHQAARLIDGLENWFPEWAEQHRSGLVAPQGVVSFIEAGWERSPTFVPAVCRFRLDLRISPRTTPAEADRGFGARLEELAKRFDASVEWTRLVAIPGTTTAPESPIIKAAIDAWETLEGRAHSPITGLSGATDANILRALGIPTARVGLPKADVPGIDFRRGMNTVSVPAMTKLTQHLILTAIAICAP
jgi:succinyl-diaminopimelate desuccinylase